MTSPAEPASSDATQASQVTKPLRELAALVLLGATAVLLFVALLRLLVPTDYSTFSSRAGSTFFAFIGFESALLPLLAVLLATHVRPTLPKAKLITQAALGEYAFAGLFGALTFLISLVGRLTDGEVLDAFLSMLSRVAWLAIFAIAAFVVFTIWRTLYYVPKPKPQPGVYGQPQPGWPQQPGGYPGQPGGYPAPGPGGYAPGGQPHQPGGYPVPGQYGSPQPAPPFNTAPPHAPQSAPPSGAPHPAPPFGQPPSADPTQAIPRQPVEFGQPAPQDTDRTQRIDRDDPNHPR